MALNIAGDESRKALGMVGLATKAGKVCFGTYMTERALREGRARVVVAAADLGKNNRKKIEYSCGARGVPLVYLSNKDELGRAVGKREAAVVCVCDDNFARALVKLSEGKEGSPNE